MPIITSIEPQKKDFEKRVNVFLDGKFAFGLDLETLVALRLKVGQELNQSEIDEIIKKAAFQKHLNNLLRFVTLRPRSEKEITDWYERKKVEEIFRVKLSEKLISLELLDDLKFAKWWIEQRLQFKSKSRKELEYELRGKGIGREIVENVFGEEEIDEGKAIKELIAKNAYKWARYDKRTAKQKMIAFLMRKGFGWEEIRNEISN